MNRPIIEELEPRPMLPPVAKRWVLNVVGIIYAFAASILIFNL